MQHIPTYCRAKHGLEEIRYPHPDLADILDETYGVICYQDQVLVIAQKFAGYTLGEADVMRKAMGKKIADVMRAERSRFIKGAKKNKYSEREAQEIFELILPFAGYAFNKAHAACYGTIAYHTAYLKANYPEEYMTAVLAHASSHPSGAHARIAAAVAECAKLGIAVLPPDINRSQANFALERRDGRAATRFGLQQIKNVGSGAAESLVAEREQNGPFASIEDFCRRANEKSLNKRVLESLVKCGALDDLGGRGTLLMNLDRLVALAQREQKLRDSGQATMFDLFGDKVATPMPSLELEDSPVMRAEELAWEKELLGVYVSEHPFKAAAAELSAHVTALCAELSGEASTGDDGESTTPQVLPPQGRDATIAGMVGNTRRLYTKAGKPFCAAEVEDLSGMVEVTVWPELFEQTQDYWIEGNILLMQVRARDRNGRLNIAVNEVELFQSVDGTPTGFQPPAWLTKTNGNGSPGNGSARPDYQDRPNGRTTPQTAVRDASRPSTPAPRPAAVAIATKTAISIELRESDDENADRERLAAILDAVRDFPGDDEVRLTVHTLDGETQRVALSPVRTCDDLTARLRDALGEAGEVR
jgi:DNA polymerase-3 subunit alpha